MQKKKFSKYLLSLLVLVLYCSIVPHAHAATGYVNRGSSSSGIYCRVTTDTRAAIVKPFYLTQSEHRKGISTTVGVTHTITVGCEASSSYEAKVGAEYAGISAEAGVSAGVSVSASYSIGSSVSYTIDSSVSDGRYRIEAVFPFDYVHIVVGTYSPAVNRIVVDTYIDRMPRPNDVYHRLTRYADAD